MVVSVRVMAKIASVPGKEWTSLEREMLFMTALLHAASAAAACVRPQLFETPIVPFVRADVLFASFISVHFEGIGYLSPGRITWTPCRHTT